MEALARASASGEAVVLATVVRVIGSSYGGVGARMVIRVDGTTVGLVSGGCLESDLCEHAVEVHSTGRARVVSYDTRADDDAVWGLGLGCNGLIDVFLQPLSPAQAHAQHDLLAAALCADQPSVLATVVRAASEAGAPEVGAQALFVAGEPRTIRDWGSGRDFAAVATRLGDALASGRRGTVHGSGSTEIALEVVNPVIRLLVCGSGPDVAPVSRMARDLGWDVTVVDHRPVTDARAARFPGAHVLACLEPDALPHAVGLTRRAAAVVMSHHFERDMQYVRALLTTDVAYIGVLGPRARTERMLAELASRGESPARNSVAMFGPVGLDLGGDGPEAIALAIVAEVSAVMHDRDANHLRDRFSALHDAVPR